MLDLAKWIKSNYYCTLFEAARVMLPSGLNVRIVCAYKARDGLTLEELDREVRLSSLERQMAGYLISSCATVERDRLLEIMGLSKDSDIPERLCSRGLVIRTDDTDPLLGGNRNAMVLQLHGAVDLIGKKGS